MKHYYTRLCDLHTIWAEIIVKIESCNPLFLSVSNKPY